MTFSMTMQRWLTVATICWASLLSTGVKAATDLPTLEDVQIYMTSYRGEPHTRELQFHTCKQTTAADWTLDYRIIETTNGTKNAIVSLVPNAPLNCATIFREDQGPKVSIDLAAFPELDAASKIIVLNPSQVFLNHDDWD